MDIQSFLGDLNVFDLLVVVALFGAFVLGFVQGTIRRLLGILSIVFSFLVTANLMGPVGDFLADNWVQFPHEYSFMLGFLVLFVAAVLAFSLVIQGTYHKAPLFEKATFVDELIGGVLGVLQAILLLLFLTIVLDTFFLTGRQVSADAEIGFLRSFWDALNTSGTGHLLHDTLIPGFVGATSLLLPDTIKSLYPR